MRYNILFSNAVKPTSWGGGEKWMLQAAKRLEDKGNIFFFDLIKISFL